VPAAAGATMVAVYDSAADVLPPKVDPVPAVTGTMP